ncbi:MAG: carbon monoxide dehydrogenase subunit G [Caldilineaceae bacterium]|nr:carbon monoxide dehydrogenase subunit G [Caldilineaceae bacterium]
MQIQGTHTFKAPRQIVWDALQDPTLLSMALPGGEQLEKLNENEYKAAMHVRVGPVQGKFEGKIELTDINEPESYRMKVSGQGAPGFVNGEGNVRLEANEGETVMHYTGDVQVGGKIAGVGQRLIDSTAKSIIRQGLAALDGQIQVRAAQAIAPTPAPPPVAEAPATPPVAKTPATPATPPVSPALAAAPVPAPPKVAPAGPSATKIATEVAKDVVRDLAADVVPLQHQEKVIWFALGAITMLVVNFLVNAIFD